MTPDADPTGGAKTDDSVPDEPVPAHPAWRHALPLTVAAIAALLALYGETTAFTVRYWENGAYSHGYLLVPIALFLIWRDREALRRSAPRPQPWGLPLLVALGLLWALAHFVDVKIVMQLALFASLAVLVWTLLGSRTSYRLAFPVGYLLLGIPIWSYMIPTLQDFTALAATRVLREFGVPIFLESYYITIPSGQFVVEDVCAGLRYLLATLSISTLYAYLNYHRLSVGIVFVAASAGISIVFNWLRVIGIIAAGHLSDMQHFLVHQHVEFGWAMFAVALVPIFAIGIWLQRFDPLPPQGTPATPPPARPSRQRALAVAVAAVAALAVGPAATFALDNSGPRMTEVALAAPAGVATWSGLAEATAGAWEPEFKGADAEIRASYGDGEATVSLYVAYYAGERPGAELVNEENALYGDRWRRNRQTERAIAAPGVGAAAVRELSVVSGAGERRLVWYWYDVGGRQTTRGEVAKLWLLWHRLTGRPSGAVVAVSTRDEPSTDEARDRLETFLGAMGARVTELLRGAGTSG